MLRANNILAIVLGLNGLCYGRPSTVQDLAIVSRVDYSDIYINTINVLDAFDAAGRGPLQDLKDGNNDTYGSLYVMDEADWDAMHHHCLEKAYTRRLEGALGHFPKEHHDQLRKEKRESLMEAISKEKRESLTEAIDYTPGSLVARADDPDPSSPWKWLCNADGPLVYEFPLAAAGGAACGAFIYTIGLLGKKQVVKLHTIPHGQTLADRYNHKIAVGVEWTFHSVQWAISSICTTAINRGISKLCAVEISGDKGNGQGSRGFSGEKFKDSNGNVVAEGALHSTEL